MILCGVHRDYLSRCDSFIHGEGVDVAILERAFFTTLSYYNTKNRQSSCLFFTFSSDPFGAWLYLVEI